MEFQEEIQEAEVVSTEIKAPSVSEQEAEEMIETDVRGSLEADFLAFNYFSLKKNYPLSLKKIENLMDSLSNGQDLITKETYIGALLLAPRNIVYKFFDEEKIYISTLPLGKGEFDYSMRVGDTVSGSQKIFKNRALAEYEGFLEAFRKLETILALKLK